MVIIEADRNFKKHVGGEDVYMQLIIIQQKLTQLCKAIVLQKQKIVCSFWSMIWNFQKGEHTQSHLLPFSPVYS